MDIIYSLTDIAASFAENLLILAFISRVSGQKYSGRKHRALVLLLSLALTAIVSCLNLIEAFSFFTIFIGVFLFIILSGFVSRGKILLRTTACALAFFFLHTLDYLTGFIVALIFDSAHINESFTSLMQPGNMRLVYTLVDKSLQTLLFFVSYPLYRRIRFLNKPYLATVLAITTVAYITMSVLLGMVITDSVVILQISVILSWMFIMLGLAAVLCALAMHTRYQEQKRESDVMNTANKLMAQNYQHLYDVQIKIAQQVHDFSNHLKALERLLETDGDAKGYVNSLLQSAKHKANRCQSGNHVIDAIINCKIEEAEQINTRFLFKVRLPNPDVGISPVDICAVLANQIDNALEACALVPQEERLITVDIWQREAFVFFKVINSTVAKDFDGENPLVSRKDNSSGTHGLGIKNIWEIAEKYEGSVDMTCTDGKFTSLVMLQGGLSAK